jgi:hypothetical protein
MQVHCAGRIGLAFLGIVCPLIAWPNTARAQVKLERKYAEGQKLTYKTTTKAHQSLTLMGMEIERHEERSVVTSLTCGKRRNDATLPLEWKVESLRTELSLPGGKRLTFDTTNPSARIDEPGLAFLGDIFRLEGEVAYTIVLDDHNKVKAIEGSEKLKERAEKLDAQARELMTRQFDSEKLKSGFEQRMQILPDVLARPGESWERTQVPEIGISGGQTLSFRKRFEYTGAEKRGDKTFDKITTKVLEVKFTTDPDSNLPLKPLKSDLKSESSGGTILFDREGGYVASSTEKVRIKGDITFSANGQEIQSTVDLNIETNVELLPSNK